MSRRSRCFIDSILPPFLSLSYFSTQVLLRSGGGEDDAPGMLDVTCVSLDGRLLSRVSLPAPSSISGALFGSVRMRAAVPVASARGAIARCTNSQLTANMAAATAATAHVPHWVESQLEATAMTPTPAETPP